MRCHGDSLSYAGHFAWKALAKDIHVVAKTRQSFELEKLSSVEDRGQTDSVTALPRPYALGIDL